MISVVPRASAWATASRIVLAAMVLSARKTTRNRRRAPEAAREAEAAGVELRRTARLGAVARGLTGVARRCCVAKTTAAADGPREATTRSSSGSGRMTSRLA
jgi:hypothetical protein